MPARVPRDGSAEQVLGRRAQEGGGARTVVLADVAAEPTHPDGGLPGRLVTGEVGGGGRLVGHRDERRAHLAAGRVRLSAAVVERPEPGAADRDVGLAEAPGAAEGVGDDNGGGRAPPPPRPPPGRPRAAPGGAGGGGPR